MTTASSAARAYLEPTPEQLLQIIEQEQSEQRALEAELPHAFYCRRSGVLLGQMIPLVTEAQDIWVRHFNEAALLHPVYSYNQAKLSQRLHAALYSAHELEWQVTDAHKQKIQLLCSAVMWSLDSIKQQRPSLPAWPTAAGSAARILALARWFWFVSSKRLAFPIYSISLQHNNLEWNNIRWWLDACFQIKEDWETKSRKAAQRQELLEASETTQLILRQKLTKRLDMKKVWNWIALQISEEYSSKQLDYWKDLFLDGDLEAHLWIEEDINDLQTAIVECCDVGNEISYFISDRLRGIRACIRDYRGGFTLIGASSNSADAGNQTSQETLMIAGLDQKLEGLTEMGPKPEQKDYPTLGTFLRAQAQWNLLNKRFQSKSNPAQGKQS
jgi:hypothetical protein